jgi:hypothetical protein
MTSRRYCDRSDVPREEWDGYVAAHRDGWVWQLSDWLDYLAAWGRRDLSTATVEGGRILGICPEFAPPYDDDPLPAPLGDAKPSATLHRGQPQRAVTPLGFRTHVVDLRHTDAELWRGLRRSYHSLIHRAQHQYVTADITPSTLCRLFVSQPELPQIPEAAWACLCRLWEAQRLWILGAWTHERRLAGAIAIYRWKGWAYYGHGRSVEPNVNHLLHWDAMRRLRDGGWAHYYEVGWEARPEDDAKAQAIAFHKAGFGGESWWVPVFTNRMEEGRADVGAIAAVS